MHILYTHIYMHMYASVCVCVWVCVYVYIYILKICMIFENEKKKEEWINEFSLTVFRLMKPNQTLF